MRFHYPDIYMQRLICMHGNKRASTFWYQASKMRDGKGKTQTYTRTHQANRTVSIPVFESRDSRIKVSNHICSIAIHAHLYCLYVVGNKAFLSLYPFRRIQYWASCVYCYFCWAKVWRIWKLKSLNKSIKTTLLSTIPYVHWNPNVKMDKKTQKNNEQTILSALPFWPQCRALKF